VIPAIASALLLLLRPFDPERVHGLALAGLRLGLAGRDDRLDDPALAVEVLGSKFANPIGLAAGFDKNAVAIGPLARLGFGLVEAGTVTPRPQAGNPRPRLFRLARDHAVINRMGMNNHGMAAFTTRLAALKVRAVPVGANVGINREGADPERDYPALVAAVAPFVDYVVINVSSPNTPGLRDLQAEERLAAILAAVRDEMTRRPSPRRPLLVKLAPDLTHAALAAIVETCVAHGAEGLILTNTTVSRPPGLRSPHAAEAGGLSGAPLFALSTAMLARAYLIARGRLILVGCGGVASGRDAWTKIRAGASLVQLYTAFAYAGPALIPRLKVELLAAARADGYARVQDGVGTDAERLAGLHA
jgi:dihydroorotate dehydrogenase